MSYLKDLLAIEGVDYTTVDLIGIDGVIVDTSVEPVDANGAPCVHSSNLWRLTVGSRIFHARTEELNDWLTAQRWTINAHLWPKGGPGWDDAILACFMTRYRALMGERWIHVDSNAPYSAI
jgi:hypothetical protein